MKKIIIAIAVTLVIVSCCVGIIVYKTKKTDFSVKFMVDGNDYAIVTTKGSETIELPANPTKEGFDFQGWYFDDGVWEKPFAENSLLDTPLSSDVSVFSYFKEIAIEYGIPEWIWTGYDTVTAKFSTSNNDTIVEPDNTTITSEITTAATCVIDGIKTYTASVNFDGKTYTDIKTETILALGHDLVPHEAQAATCTEIGWEEYSTCSRCDHTTYAEISALGHTNGTPINENVIDATCTVNGTYDEVIYCTVCEEEISRTPKTENALGHDLVPHEAQSATCTEIGWEEYSTCSRCDHTTYVEIPALGHTTVVDSAIAPTCTQTGLTEGSHCSVCNEKFVVQEIVVATGHNWIDANCTNPKTCSYCSLTQGEALGHNFDGFDCARCNSHREYYYDENDFIYFGTYPQSEVTDDATADTLDGLAGTLPNSSVFNGWTNYEYYIGENAQNSASKAVAYMWYKDVTLENGQKYRGVFFKKFRPFYSTNVSDMTQTWQDNNSYYYSNSNIYWFKFEPIKWETMSVDAETGERLLLAELILDGQAFNDVRYYNSVNGKFYNRNENTPNDIYANNWQWSTIRAWLNDSFYNLAFSDAQHDLIQTTTLDNQSTAPRGNYNNYAVIQSNTDDNVFLLSYSDMCNEEFGFTPYEVIDLERAKRGTDYALIQGIGYNGMPYEIGKSPWWTRSPDYETTKNVIMLSYRGEITSLYGVDHTAGGVVPALHIKLPEYGPWIYILNATCTKEGQKYRVSADGKYLECCIIPALGHTGGSATCVDKAVCAVCNQEYGAPLGHTWTPATCYLPKTCSVCLTTDGEPLTHVWTLANCTTPKTCSLCSLTEGVALGHSGGTASCNTLAVCEVCGLQYGEYEHMSTGECTLCTSNVTMGLIYEAIDEGAAYSVRKGTSTIEELVIPAYYNGKPVREIKAQGFESLGITSAFIPHTVTNIGDNAFTNCESLIAVTFGADSLLAQIGEYAFSQCSLSSMVLDSNVTAIGYRAFYNCVSITIYCEAESKPTNWHEEWLGSTPVNLYWASDWCYDGEGIIGAHEGGTATCTAKAVCTRCSQPYGELLEHVYDVAWTYDSANHWHVCTGVDCTSIADKAVHSGGTATCINKAVCSACAQEYGELSEHTPITDVAVAATCVATGLTQGSHCSFCDTVLLAQETTPIIPHTWVAGTCSSCSAISYLRTTEGDDNYVYFGSYPQTIKAASVTISATADANGHYTGSDGAKYVKIIATPEKTLKFSTNATITEGTAYYFKVEPIKWRILSQTNGKALILCESAIANVPYAEEFNNYEESAIRAWLNEQFIETAFASYQKSLILTTTVDNSAATTGAATNPYACPDTNDKIFLLSCADVQNADYGFTDDESRMKITTDYCRAMGGWTSDGSTYPYGNTCWWLRSPLYSSAIIAKYVYPDGTISNIKTNRPSYTAAPALMIDFCLNGHTSTEDCICSMCGQEYHVFSGNSCHCNVCGLLSHNFVNYVCSRCGEEQIFVRAENTVYFGSYPQTKVSDSTLIDTLNGLAGTLPISTNSYSWTSYGYLIDGEVSNYMWYVDKEKDGNKYRGVYFQTYRSTKTEWDEGSYQDNNGYYTSNVYWFKFEPIKWIILSEDGSQALLVADLILDTQEYNDTVNNHTGGYYSNNWEKSTIRKWLRDSFMQTAFTESQKNAILGQTLNNKTTGIDGSGNTFTTCQNDTTDKVFLLSFQDIYTASYALTTTVCQKQISDYAQAQGSYKSTDSLYLNNGQWWLRTAANMYGFTSFVNYKGITTRSYVDVTSFGIVPALVLSIG